jgi:hypothetical protein
MSKAKETIKAIQASHSALFVVSATAIALLFASPKTNYSEALNEANELRSLRMADYEDFAEFATTGNYMLPKTKPFTPGNWSGEIVKFLDSELSWQVHPASSPRHDITPILQYPTPPTSGSVKDWLAWMSSTENVKFWQPEWAEAGFSVTRDAPESPPIVRFFSVKPSSFQRTPGEYTFRAFLDWNVTEADLTQQTHFSTDVVDDWWTEIDRLNSRELWGGKKKEGPLRHDDRFVIEGDVNSKLEVGANNSGIRHWLKSSGAWDRLSKTTDLGESILPGMHAHWSEISDLTLNEAIAFMEERMTAVQDVNVFGIPVPGRLCAVAIPIAFLVVLMRMLLNSRHLSSIKDAVASDGIHESPWIGLYSYPLARWVTDISLVAVPVGLSSAIIAKYYAHVDWTANVIAILFVVLSGVCSIDLIRHVRDVRSVLVAEQSHAQEPVAAPDSHGKSSPPPNHHPE